MAANLASSRVPGGHRFTVVSFDLHRLHAIRSKHAPTRLPLAFSLAVTGAVVVGVLALGGAPLWLAATFGIIIAALVPAFADTGRVSTRG